MAIGDTQLNRNLYQNFSKVDYASNRAYLKNAYANNTQTNKVEYYNDEKKEKKKKRNKSLVIGSSVFVLAASLFLGFRGKNIHYKDIKNSSKTLYDKMSNFSVNFTNLKDDAWDRFATFLNEKTPFKFIKKVGDGFSNWYRSNVYKALKSKFNAAQSKILDTAGGYKFRDQLKNYDDVFKGLDKNIKEISVQDRISSSENLFKGNQSRFKNLIHNITSPIADANIKPAVNEYANILEIPAGASKELRAAIERYNKLQKNSLIPKLRDINYGCAPTDILTVGAPIAAFSAALCGTEDKEEKKSLLFNLGIPLVPTVVMPIMGTIFPVLNGIKAMLAGFAVGQVVSQGVKVLDKKLFENKSEEKA